MWFFAEMKQFEKVTREICTNIKEGSDGVLNLLSKTDDEQINYF